MDKLYVDVFEENANRPLPIRREYGAGGGSCDLNLSYSYEEQDTGLTWLDGRKIYQKSFELNKPSVINTWADTEIGEPSIAQITDIRVLLTHDNYGTFTPLPYVRPSSSLTTTIGFRGIDYNSVGIVCNNMEYLQDDKHYIATVQYTCTDR